MDMQAFLRFFCDSAVSFVLTLYGCTIAEEYHGYTQPGASMDEAALDNCEQVFSVNWGNYLGTWLLC